MFKEFIQVMTDIEHLWGIAAKTNDLADWAILYGIIQEANQDKNKHFGFVLEDLDFLQTIVFQIYTDLERGK